MSKRNVTINKTKLRRSESFVEKIDDHVFPPLRGKRLVDKLKRFYSSRRGGTSVDKLKRFFPSHRDGISVDKLKRFYSSHRDGISVELVS